MKPMIKSTNISELRKEIAISEQEIAGWNVLLEKMQAEKHRIYPVKSWLNALHKREMTFENRLNKLKRRLALLKKLEMELQGQ